MVPAKLPGLVKRFEGLARVRGGLVYPYICPAGYATQGYGLLVPSLNVPPITVQEAEARLMRVLPKYVDDTLDLCPVLAGDEDRLAAIADFTFNLGAGRLRASTLRRKVEARDWVAARRELRKWVWGGGRRLPGLVLRREAEAALL